MKTDDLYNTCVSELVNEEAFENYTKGTVSDHFVAKLAKIGVSQLIDGPIRDQNLAQCCLSGLWLLHNDLHQSHEISQSIKTPEGSWWHAIMHRIEGDFWNSKYWYRQIGEHDAAVQIGSELGSWDPASFVDQCELGAAETHRLACVEWKSLFDYCLENAGEPK